MKKTRLLKILIIITLAFIWIHSTMPPDVSSDESGFVVKILEGVFGTGNVSELLVRKLAHFTEYCLLGLELMACTGSVSASMSNGLFAAAVDETIQIFSNRGSSLADVWIDFAGCLLGVLIIYLIRRKKKKT